eukprot:COSAG01_NODE_4416_length_5047_cov_4.569523_5_plen_390_part_00
MNLHFTQMNLEGGTNGLCGHSVGSMQQLNCHTGCHLQGGCGDYIEIYDGRDATAPLIAHVTGVVTDARGAQDSFTSTGRNMFVRFVTDTGNYGLTGTTEDPGFWLEWQMLEAGQQCLDYTVAPNMGIVGHNNEIFTCSTAATATCEDQCEAACCLRDWCRSFDMATGSNSCALSDVDSRVNHGATVAWAGGALHERNYPAPTPAPLGSAGCVSRMASLSTTINSLCCPVGGCHGSASTMGLTSCSAQCEAIWSPFALECSEWLRLSPAQGGIGERGFQEVNTMCENEEYGRYHPGAAHNHGRCSDSDLAMMTGQLGPACCGDHYQYCGHCTNAGCNGAHCIDCTGTGLFQSSLLPTMDGTHACAHVIYLNFLLCMVCVLFPYARERAVT